MHRFALLAAARIVALTQFLADSVDQPIDWPERSYGVAVTS